MLDKKKRTGKQHKLYLWVAVILLIIVGGSSAFFIYFEGNQETATSQHISTATATATPTITPNISTPTVPRLLFFDDFLDNTKGWAISDTDDYTRTISDGKLTLSAFNHKLLVESLPTNPVHDFSLSMTFTLQQADKNDSIGLFLRGDSNLDHDYRIDIYGNSTYAISKESLDEDNQQVIKTMVDQTHTPRLKGIGQQNILTVMMKGSEMVLLLNGAIIQTVSDTDYTRGQIAIFVENGSTSNGATASISSVFLYSAPEQLPK